MNEWPSLTMRQPAVQVAPAHSQAFSPHHRGGGRWYYRHITAVLAGHDTSDGAGPRGGLVASGEDGLV